MFPRVVVFDLDGTWWCPDMYELWGGGGAPFKRIANTDSAMLDKGKNTVQLLDGTMRLVSELWHWSQNHRVPAARSCGANNKSCASNNGGEVPFIIAAASTCDEPRWAQELLKLFHTRPHPFDKQVLINNSANVMSKAPSGGRHGGSQKSAGKVDDDEVSSSIHINDGHSYGGGGVVSYECVLGQYDEIYKGNKRTHMANILQKFKQSKSSFRSMVSIDEDDGKIYIPPLFAAAMPAGISVCPQTGLVTFTDLETAEALKAQLLAENDEPISYKDFIFFDNQMNNIHDVGRANICSVYVPEGMTMNNWAKGLQQWRREQRPFKVASSSTY